MPHSIGPLAYARGGAARLRSRWGRSLTLAVVPLAYARGGAARLRSRWGRSLTLAVGPLAYARGGGLAHARCRTFCWREAISPTGPEGAGPTRLRGDRAPLVAKRPASPARRAGPTRSLSDRPVLGSAHAAFRSGDFNRPCAHRHRSGAQLSEHILLGGGAVARGGRALDRAFDLLRCVHRRAAGRVRARSYRSRGLWIFRRHLRRARIPRPRHLEAAGPSDARSSRRGAVERHPPSHARCTWSLRAVRVRAGCQCARADGAIPAAGHRKI